ncbi:e8ecc75b-5dfd-4f6b-ab37-5c3fd5e2b28f [Thermothielavioides terrestris]|uniref:E8ecc75b-5dfd-4f6b-ab37-5c3fd5e2b28f n=1 Tax=Thermothielavioides terrestris TaxID=2587410 RepID=A0A3S4F4A4_9PEZI|nr:e8ecc75b-5dfd-4f6b-ab37-5c3fd5e2b28f [Thermothielavioides terrestris]
MANHTMPRTGDDEFFTAGSSQSRSGYRRRRHQHPRHRQLGAEGSSQGQADTSSVAATAGSYGSAREAATGAAQGQGDASACPGFLAAAEAKPAAKAFNVMAASVIVCDGVEDHEAA